MSLEKAQNAAVALASALDAAEDRAGKTPVGGGAPPAEGGPT